MRAFTPQVEKWLKIIALNRKDPGLRETFERTVLPLVANEARLVTLMLLGKKQEEIDRLSARLPTSNVESAQRIYAMLISEADSALGGLDTRLQKAKFGFSSAA